MHTQDVRRKFLNYFKEKNHTIVASAPVVPHDDPTLLFNNAGMNQFKDVFLGNSVRDYNRATSSQKSIRVGGKHNDLDNVGHTHRHLTFFEMLGNFSFGDYFKKEAIDYSWELSTEVFGFEEEKIWATVFREDDEAYELWKKYLPENKIVRFDEKDNFWAMGDTGPCGPCSELHYDRGDKYGSATHPYEDSTGDRFLEFWNLVFMQYNKDESGVLTPLPNPCIDTGAGLERIVGLLMGVESVFQTDVLRSLIAQIEEVSGVKYDSENKAMAPAFHVIADHLRSLSFAIADGAQPGNVDRGYVLRKILRRAVRYGRTLGMHEPFLAKIYPRLLSTMGEDYPELKTAQTRIQDLLTTEEEGFMRTLRRGGSLLSEIIDYARRHAKRISGDDAFKLKDTYGFPIEEILLIAKDSGLHVDLDRFEELEKEARDRSRKVHKSTKQVAVENLFVDYNKENGPCEFLGYGNDICEASVTAIVVDGLFVESIVAGKKGMIVLDKSSFYAEMGGQVGDTGFLQSSEGLFDVRDCQAPYSGVIAHLGVVEKGKLSLGDSVRCEVDGKRRQKIANNHTATHLLHWALHEVLGEHIRQAGSVVDDQRLRFDFSHHKALTSDEIREIENLVNAKVRENRSVDSYELSYEEVQERQDIKQFFGDKYGDKVRVVDIDYSKELCGGIHTSQVGNIGLFRITKESSIAAGIRRIEATSGFEAEIFSRQGEDSLGLLAELLKTHPNKLTSRVNKLLEENHDLTQVVKELKKGQMGDVLNSVMDKLEIIEGTPILTAIVSMDAGELRTFAGVVMDKMKSGVLVLGTASDGKCNILAKVSDDLQNQGIKANEIIKTIAPIIGGGGGGKSDLAQAGGKAPERLLEALAKARELFEVKC
ncbi:MAG: alanyl-tRNA synthetase [Chlamydiales bacterium]|jgi:alanyl-tRNA synthetase